MTWDAAMQLQRQRSAILSLDARQWALDIAERSIESGAGIEILAGEVPDLITLLEAIAQHIDDELEATA